MASKTGGKSGRGAKAPRSAVSAKTKAKGPKAKPAKAKPAKAKPAKAKPAKAKPAKAAKAVQAKAKAKAKAPAAKLKAKAKPAKATKATKPAKAAKPAANKAAVTAKGTPPTGIPAIAEQPELTETETETDTDTVTETQGEPAEEGTLGKLATAAKGVLTAIADAVRGKPTSDDEGADQAAASNGAAPGVETLGTVTCPSGKLAVFDIGLIGYMPRAALEPAIVKVDVPRDRELSISGTRVGHGQFADCWDHVVINLAEGEVQKSKKLGSAGVDFARIAILDHKVLDHWQHEESLDGLADVMFWGRDDAALAKALKAPKTKEGYGWLDLPLEDAESKIMEAEILKAENDWQINVDFRPHSHHYQILAAARANPTGAGELQIAGSKMLLFFTSWGDGVFPIFLDLDAEDRPLRIRIQLATAESTAAMQAAQ